MRQRKLTWILAAAALLAMGASKPLQFIQTWDLESHQQKYEKLLVIGISPDETIRHHFEDKFVTHLRSRGLAGLTSHSLVPELRTEADRREVMTALREQDVDAAISVRIVTLQERTPEEWAAFWEQGPADGGSIRELVDSVITAPPTKSKQWAVEIGMWDLESRRRVWAARTDPIKKRRLQESGGTLMQMLISLIQHDRLMPSDDELQARRSDRANTQNR